MLGAAAFWFIGFAGKAEPQGIIDALFSEKVSVKDLLAAVEGVFLRDRSLRFAKFDESRLYAADMIRSDLSRATFQFAELQGTQLIDAHMFGAKLVAANLSVADLSGARLNNAYLFGANLSGARLRDVRNLTQAQLDLACGKPQALPEGLTLDKPCPPQR